MRVQPAWRRGAVSVRMIVWLTGLVLWPMFVRWDNVLMQWRYALVGDKPDGFFRHLLASLREFAQAPCVVIILIVVVAYHRHWPKVVAAVLLAELFAGIGYNAGKLLIARYRPQEAIARLADPPVNTDAEDLGAERHRALSTFTWRQTWLGWQPMNTDADLQSFPSGHSAGAFVLAGTLAVFYRRIAWLLWILAVGCALSRYFDAVHWASDCVLGMAIGLIAAQLALRLVLGRKQTSFDHFA